MYYTIIFTASVTASGFQKVLHLRDYSLTYKLHAYVIHMIITLNACQ